MRIAKHNFQFMSDFCLPKKNSSDIDDNVTSLSEFSPEKIFETVSKCLLLIKSTLELPTSLPPSMAQRFSVATKLSEACVVSGVIFLR